MESNPRAKTEGWVYNTAIQGSVPRCRKIESNQIQTLERMERMEFTRGAWFSESAGDRESLFGFVALESDVYSSGTIGEATVAATQALGYIPVNETSVARSRTIFCEKQRRLGVLPTGFGKSLCYGCPSL